MRKELYCFPSLTLFSAVLLILSCMACKSPNTTGMEPALGLEEDAGEHEIPMEMWTPSRRQVNAYYYFMIGEYESLKNNRVLARRYYEDAYNLDPNAYLGAKWIAAKASTENNEEVLLEAKKMVLLYPKEVEIHILYGQLLAARGMLKEAQVSFNRAIALDQHRLEPYLGLIGIQRASGNINSAISIAKEMLEMEPGFAEGWALLAKLYLTNDEAKKALPAAERAYDLRSGDPEHVHLYALTLELNGQSKKAVNLYEVIFRLNPNNDELIQRMVALYKQIGDLEDALKLLKDAEERIGKVTLGIRLQMVFIYWELERFREASELLDELAKRFPDSDRIIYMSGLGQEKIGRLNEALQTFKKVEDNSPFYVHAAYRSIAILKQLKSYDEALKLALQVIELDHERSVDFYTVAASIYVDKNQLDDAIDLLKKGSEQHPNRSDILFLLGVYYEKAGQLELCTETMRRVIEVDSEHAGAYNYLGYLYAERGENLAEAEQLIKRALEIKPGDGYYLDSLGWVYFQQKRYKEAIKILIEANEAAPNEAVILEHLADCYEALGDEAKAYELYQSATQANMEERDRERILEKYEALKKKFDNDAES